MHEASLVRTLLAQVAEVARRHGATVVERIELEVGPLSGVEPDLLRSAFLSLRDEAGCGAATLDVHVVPLVAECPTCHERFELVEFVFRCPRGCPGDVRIVQGDGCLLKRVACQVPDDSGVES